MTGDGRWLSLSFMSLAAHIAWIGDLGQEAATNGES